ncbi:NAD(P)-dependent alcohol dehydrogenase [Mycolicibacterium arenosum]|uniref:NAD(P)-dependent alcohol dehydrogenase n=1 Tax=Mycolicibacterium arenosum TaxID=2952157 RepID=A0ABT1M621_9MYCO|nr:NAD(P)-dependent alcohol dehydrogenase [Mycolicibacterium sp. CAU 1645]MCP9274621.1 NAD(P)-dependent alcohol dehydrogenase [Mycolicibacterium sp. CAU 1645]
MIDARAAVVFAEGADPELADVQVRPPADDEVLVRIEATGICHTDVSVSARWPARKLPMVFGHEGVGIVVEAAPGARAAVGDRVVLTFASCGGCANCLRGRPAYCAQSTTLNMRGDTGGALSIRGNPLRGGFFGQSSFATHVLARPANTVVVGSDVDPALAAPLGCSVQTGVGTVLNAMSVGADDALVVFGAGAVGLSAVMGAVIAGCAHIVAVDPIAERRALATELGATAVIDPAVDDAAAVLAALPGGGPTAAIDTTALAPVIAGALAALQACGTLALVGLGALTAELPVGLVMAKGLRVRGVVEGDGDPHVFIPRLAELWRRGELPLEKLVTRFEFTDFDRAWSAAKGGRAVKPVLILPR